LIAPFGVRGEWVLSLLDALQDVDTATLYRTHGLLPDLLREPLCRLPIETVTALLEEASARCDDPLLGVHLAQRRHPRGLLHYLTISQEDLGAALERLARYAHLQLGGGALRLTRSATAQLVCVWPALPLAHRQIAEAALAGMCRDLQDAAGAPLRFDEVRLRGGAMRSVAEYEQVFGCPVRFEQADHAIVLPLPSLRVRMRRRNQQVAQRLERTAGLELEIVAAASTRARVETIVRSALREGECYERETVARRLVCSPRALRRSLEHEGTSFREIEECVRRDVAVALVRDTRLSLVEVAQRCGFAGLAAFSKAFKRWTTCAPSDFRQQHAAVSAAADRRPRLIADARDLRRAGLKAAAPRQRAAAGSTR